VYENLSYTHNKAYKKIHEMISNAKVGISKNIEYFEPMRPSSIFDKSIVKIAEYLDKKWFLKKVKNNLDFLGVQYYFRSKLKFKLGGKYLNLFDECSISNHKVDGCERDDIGLEIYPEGIFHILMDLKKMNKPIIITENGVADRRDKLRERFIKDHLLNIHKAIQKGVNVRGYIYWSLMDNFEWYLGRAPRFGLVEIDYEKNLKRKVRKSAWEFSKIIKNNGFNLTQEIS